MDTSVFMGLENFLTDTSFQQVILRRKAIRRTVIFEQRRQLNAGIYNPDEIAQVSGAESGCSVKRAHIIGLIHSSNR